MLEKSGNQDIYMFLSRNETLATYKETEDELLLAQVKMLLDAKERDKLNQPEDDEESDYNTLLDSLVAASGTTVKQSNIWHSLHVITYLQNLYTLGPHFTRSKLMKVVWLKRMTEIHGGVSARS